MPIVWLIYWKMQRRYGNEIIFLADWTTSIIFGQCRTPNGNYVICLPNEERVSFCLKINRIEFLFSYVYNINPCTDYNIDNFSNFLTRAYILWIYFRFNIASTFHFTVYNSRHYYATWWWRMTGYQDYYFYYYH